MHRLNDASISICAMEAARTGPGGDEEGHGKHREWDAVDGLN